MDDHIRTLDIKIQNKEGELNGLFSKTQKLVEEIATLRQKIDLQKAGNSGEVIIRRPRGDL